MGSTAVIVAAGAGSRLGELGSRLSKPMIPLLGMPLIGRVIERLHRAGFARLVVVAHPDNSALLGYLQTEHPTIRLAYQDERRGMADAVARALPLLPDAPYLACACDSLFLPEDIARVATLGREHAASAALGVLAMGAEATSSRSAVVLEGSRVIDIREKPAPGTVQTDLVGMPLYWLPRSIDRFLQAPPEPGKERQVADALADFIHARGELRAARVHERLEITRPEDIATVEGALHRR